MEYQPGSDPVAAALEKVIHTMTGEPVEESTSDARTYEQAPPEDSRIAPSPQATEIGHDFEDTIKRPIRLRALARAVNNERRKREAAVFSRPGSANPNSLKERLAEFIKGDFTYVFEEDDTLLPKEGEENFARVIRCNREDGLREIHRTVGSQDKEHSWVFIPAEGIWIDVALKASARSTQPDQQLLLYLSRLYPQVEEVHTHPSPSLWAVRHSIEFSPMNYLVVGTLPSAADLRAHYVTAAQAPADSRIISRVVSEYGVTTYSMTPGSGNIPENFYTTVPGLLQDHFINPAGAVPEALADYRKILAQDFADLPDLSIDFKPLL